MHRFPRLSPNDDEHRRLVVSLVWRYGLDALRIARCAVKDTQDGVFPSPVEAILCYNIHWDSFQFQQAAQEKVDVDSGG